MQFLRAQWSPKGSSDPKHARCSWHEIMIFTYLLFGNLVVFHSRHNYWVFCVTVQERKIRVLFLTFVMMFGESQCPINQNGISWKDQFMLPCALVMVLQRNRTNRVCVCAHVCGEREIDWNWLIIGLAHIVMEAWGLYNLPSACWRTRKAGGVIQFESKV